MNLMSRIEPDLGSLEDEYRLTFLRDDIRIARAGVILWTLFTIFFAYNDYLFFGKTAQFWVLAVCRVALVTYGIVVLFVFRKLEHVATYEWLILCFLLVGTIFVFYVNTTRPASYNMNVALDVVIVFGLYLLFPNNVMFRILPAFLFSLCTVLVAILYRGMPVSPALVAMFLSLALANSAGLIISARWSHLRRSLFKTITESKQSEKALAQAKRDWEHTFDAVPDLIAILDDRHRIVKINKAMADELGVTKEIAVGLACYETVHGQNAPPPSCPHAKLIADGKPYTAEVTEKRLGGTFDVSVSPLFSEQGDLVGYVHVAHDITQRKNAEEQLRESEERYRTLVSISPDAMLVSVQGRLAFANIAAIKMLGMSSPHELIGKDQQEIIHPDSWETVRERVRILLEDGKPLPLFEQKLIRRDGSIVHVETAAAPIMYEGKLAVQVVLRDVTERKLAEEDRRKQYELQRVLLSAIPAYVYFKDTNSVYIAGNERFTELTGIPENEIPGKTDYDFFSQTDADSFRRDDAQIMTTGEARLNYKMQGTDAKGNTIWYSTSKSPFYDSFGAIAGLVGICMDITPSIEAENALRESERRYRMLIETANDAVYLTDYLGNFTYLNPVALFRSGFTEEELIGKSFLVTVHPDYRAEVADFYVSQFRNKILQTYYELPVLAKHGEIIWIGQNVHLLIEGDRIVGFQSIARDVTDRRKAENALRESEERFRQLAENVDDIFMLIQSTHPYSFIYVSPSYERVTHCKVDDLCRDPSEWLKLVSNEFRNTITQTFHAFVESYKDFNSEFQIIRPGGDARWIWATGFAIKDSEGKVSRLGMTARDITKRKSDEERLEHLVEEVKDFAYIISHDCRAPLINIQGFAKELESALRAIEPAVRMGLPYMEENLRSQTLTALEEDIPEALGFIRASVSRMDGLIGAMLDLSRLEHRELHIELLDMNGLVEETLKSLSYQLEETGSNVHVDGLPQIKADRLALEQVMTNLVNNAIKFRDSKRAQEISITGHRFPDETVFVVRDRGRGVDPTYLSQIFQIFHRGSVLDVPGEGIGLAHVRTLVRRHGGRIWCESSPGSGSTFTFTISNQL